MKISVLLLVAGIFQATASSYSQDEKISLSMQNSSMQEFLSTIEKKTQLKFLYRDETIDNKLVNVNAVDVPVQEVLDKVFENSDIIYKTVGNGLIVITSKNFMQQLVVSGVVKDGTSGDPLPGVNVVIKGTTTGTITDIDGKFSLQVPDGNVVLLISFVGYNTEEIDLAGRTQIEVQLIPSIENLDEVIVIGYGTQKKSDLTGSVASINSEDFEQQPVTSFSQAIQGRIPGVSVTNNSGAPGGAIKIRIRGANSMLGSNEPLYVVDGVALNIGIGDININDIESIEVLKDASATAIYGSRGANGVVMITTKRGKGDKPTIQVNINNSINKLAKKYDLMNAGDYAELVNVYKPDYFTAQEITDFKANGGVDWQDEIFRIGSSKDYQASLTGGTEKTKYYISGNYLDQEGIVLRTYQKKYSIRSNINSELSSKLRLDLNMYANRLDGLNTKDNGWKGAPPWAAVIYSPTFPIYTPEGLWNRQDNLCSPNAQNPLMLVKERHDDYLSNTLTLNSKLGYKILEGLTFDLVYGVDYNSYQGGGFQNTWANSSTTTAYLNESKTFTWQNSNILTYQKNINDIHAITLSAIYEQSQFTYSGFGANGSNINPITVGYYNLGIAGNKNISSYQTQSNLRSYVGRVSYSLLNRYLVTATYRADGTSKFQGDNKWGYFPSAAIGWKISEEAFLRDVEFIQQLKLRGSWGVTGNQGINPYATIAKIGSMMNTYGLNVIFPGSIIEGADNPNLKWESTTQTNFGFDFSVLQGRASLSVDYFNKKTSDLLHQVSIPSYNGGGKVNKNIGEMENKGFEVYVAAIPVSTSKVKWDISFNISAYRNKLLSLGADTFLLAGNYSPGLTQESPFAIKVGEPLGSFWGYTWQGIYKTSEAAEAAVYGANPGDNKYLDYNNDGKIDSKDKHIIGNAIPKYMWGLNNNLSIGNVEINLLLQAVKGNKVLNTAYACAASILTDATSITHVDGKNYWTPENENAKFANPASSTDKNFIESTHYLQDGSYIKVKNISLAYNISRKTLKVADVRLALSAQNLLTFTDYIGFDPEASTAATDIDGAIDVGAYPSARTYTFGVQVTF